MRRYLVVLPALAFPSGAASSLREDIVSAQRAVIEPSGALAFYADPLEAGPIRAYSAGNWITITVQADPGQPG